jgi:hypothetical protein
MFQGVFERVGFKLHTASSTKVSTGRFGYEVTNDFLMEEIKPFCSSECGRSKHIHSSFKNQKNAFCHNKAKLI